ncbi:MAG: T9SS type A sorting domain-containing protein [candidate division Zixibacteria bacterium]
MKNPYPFLLICLLLTATAFAEPPKNFTTNQTAIIDNTTFIDANKILMFVTNHGNIGRDLSGYFGYDYGTFFPYDGNPDDIINGNPSAIRSPLYAGGLWLGGVDASTGDTVLAISEYGSEYVPGPMDNGTFMDDQWYYQVYKLFGDSLASNPNQDYLDYINYADEQGAPLNDSDQPEMIGDQMCWAVYNDADAGKRGDVDGGLTDPIGIQVKQTVFAFDQMGSLGNTIFLRFRIYNEGTRNLNNFYISIWADPDLGGAGDDYVGCDTLNDIGFCYNADGDDNHYAHTPPCLGIKLLQTPLRPRFISDPDIPGRMWGQTYADSINIGMVSFNKYINGTDPDNYKESYWYMNGLDKFGNPYQYNSQTLLYVHSGNPVAGTGDLDFYPADRRFMMTTGPLSFNPGDSTEIIAALIVGQGPDRLNSISIMKNIGTVAQDFYDNNFGIPTAVDENVNSMIPGQFALKQNQPNPFNPGTNIEFYLPRAGFVEMKIYNILGELVDEPLSKHLNPGIHNVYWDGIDSKNKQLPSGIYFYQLNFGNESQTKKMLLMK